MKTLLKTLMFIFIASLSVAAYGQCSQDKDAIKYKQKVDSGENVQQCSQCALMAIYFCSATYTKPTDAATKQKIRDLIATIKMNLETLGKPYCCDELYEKAKDEDKWGWGKNSAD